MGRVDWDLSKRIDKLYEEYDIGQVRFTEVPKTVKYMSPPKGATWLTDQKYWDSRNIGFLAPRKRMRFKKQQGICPLGHCKMRCDDVLETPHIKPKSNGGKDQNSNVALVHHQCHNLHHLNPDLATGI